MSTSAIYLYDPLGRLTGVQYDDCASLEYQYDELGNRVSTCEKPPCRIKYDVINKSGSFTASGGSGSFYLISATATVTLTASSGDGSVMKFKVTGGTGTFAFTGDDQFFHANGVADQNLVLTSGSGVLELVSVDGGYVET